jgi:hypothetical protein
MDKLPVELLSRIIKHVTDECVYSVNQGDWRSANSMATYSVLNRQWQLLVEPITFKQLTLTTSCLASSITKEILTPDRLSYLRSLVVEFIFPAREGPYASIDEGGDDQTVFNRTVKDLFHLLERVPPCEHPWLLLRLQVPMPREYLVITFGDYTLSAENGLVARGELPISYLELSPDLEDELPELPAVLHLTTGNESHSRVFSPRSICLLASKMTRLKRVDLELSDRQKLDLDRRIQQRGGKSNMTRL